MPVSNYTLHIQCEVPGKVLSLAASEALLTGISKIELAIVGGVSKITWDHRPQDGRYEWSVVTKDGREWKQLVDVPATGDALLEFYITGKWASEEGLSQIDARKAMIVLTRAFEVKKMTCDFA